MRAKKISMFLAVIIGMGMILCGMASAGDNQNEDIYFELRASGKGIQITDPDSHGYIESKHKVPKNLTFYAWVDRTLDSQNVWGVLYNADTESWEENGYGSGHNGCALATDNGYLMRIGSVIYMGEDKIALRSRTDTQVTLKEKEGELQSGKVKTIAGTYQCCSDDSYSSGYEGTAAIKRRGGLKIKGKLIAWGDLPQEVQDIFTDIEAGM